MLLVHNICFYGEISKIIPYLSPPTLSVPLGMPITIIIYSILVLQITDVLKFAVEIISISGLEFNRAIYSHKEDPFEFSKMLELQFILSQLTTLLIL